MVSTCVKDLTKLIGNTPLVELRGITASKLSSDFSGHIYGKLENLNPLASVKDRIGIAMIEDAEHSGRLKKGIILVEPTSGNTGIALAYICAIKGYKLKLTMPESMSIERRKLMASFGAELVLTPAEKGMNGAVTEAKRILEENTNSIMLDQFNNPANPEYHYKTTGREILDATANKIDIFIAGVGTGGTITGVGKRLKEFNKNIQIIAMEPFDSPVLSGGKPGPHKIQGIGAGFVPGILDRSVIDEIMTVKLDDAFETSRLIMKTDGIFAGISSGANVWSALQIAQRKGNEKKNIVTIICDTAERYLSTMLFQ
ncbi:MAG: cysteine synthase A [Proteobacteria bacterium]|nr:cysteine synthase A [Pseudomonadota bacterium]